MYRIEKYFLVKWICEFSIWQYDCRYFFIVKYIYKIRILKIFFNQQSAYILYLYMHNFQLGKLVENLPLIFPDDISATETSILKKTEASALQLLWHTTANILYGYIH